MPKDPASLRREFDGLCRRYAPGLVRHFQRRLGGRSAELAEELSQRTWVQFWKALESGAYDPARSSHSTFLYAVASIIWLRALREWSRESQRTLRAEEGWLEETTQGDPAQVAQAAELIDLVARVVSGSDPHAPFDDSQREFLRLISQDLSEREIAQRLGISPSTAHERKKALIGQVLAYLRGRGVDFPAKGRAGGSPRTDNPVEHP